MKKPLTFGGALARLYPHHFAVIPYALARIGIGLPDLADTGGNIA
jgi:hypothetical protein